MTFDGVHTMLEQWGRWSWERAVRGHTSPAAIVMRDNIGTVLPPAPAITDEDAMAVDYLVARLNHKDSVLGEAVIQYFRYGLSMRQLAVHMGCGKALAEMYVKSGVAWIDGHLEGHA